MNFMDAGQNIRIGLDDKTGRIVVSTYNPPIPGFHWFWKEAGRFSREEWEKSEFFNRVTNEDVKTTIAYFWFDVEQKDAGDEKPNTHENYCHNCWNDNKPEICALGVGGPGICPGFTPQTKSEEEQ